MSYKHVNDSVHWYMNELTSRVVAKSGIPTDRFHLGKIILQSLKDDLDFVSQVDGGTGATESNGSVLKRTIQCALYFKKLGLKKGDVMVLMAPNHLDLVIPFYAATYLGIIIAPVDRTLRVGELELTFKIYKPAILFCQNEKRSDVEAALKSLDLNSKIITFDREGNGPCFADLLTADDKQVNNFEPEDFNTEDDVAMILPTSGSTGFPKGAAITYKCWMITGPYLWIRSTKFPTPTSMALILAPMQWLSAAVNYVVSPFFKFTRLQTSKPLTEDHIRYLIETFKPTFVAVSPTMISQLLKPGLNGHCDITSFEVMMIGGSAVHKEIIQEVETASPKTKVMNVYGMTELTTLSFQGDSPPPSCGKPIGLYQYRLVDPETGRDVFEANVNGELWLKGPGMFTEYYNDPVATKEAFSEDRWLKTGDMFYRDEHSNYYFVERIKLLLKYKSYQISPVELEGVIRAHPGVIDVAVTGLEDPDCGELPVACIIPRPGYSLTAQEIKDLVKEKLSDAKQLRGGVAFISALPVTASTKIHRTKLKQMVRNMKLE